MNYSNQILTLQELIISLIVLIFAFSVYSVLKTLLKQQFRGSIKQATPKETPKFSQSTYKDELLKFNYDDFHLDDYKRYDRDDGYDYFESKNSNICKYVEMMLCNEFDDENEEEILLYLICYIGYHPYTNLYKYRLFSLLIMLRMKYGMILTKDDIKGYRICRCWNNGRPTVHAYIGGRDCANEDEYRLLYQYYRENINTSNINDISKASLSLFLLQSRFAGCYSHTPLTYIDFNDIIVNFIKYAKKEMKKDKHNTLLSRTKNRRETYDWLSKGLLYYIKMEHKAKSIELNKAAAREKYNKLKNKVKYYERILGICNIPNRPKLVYVTDLQAQILYYEKILHLRSTK